MTAKKLTFRAIEDNAGGLHLGVFEAGELVYYHAGYQFDRGQLVQDIAALRAGEHPAGWSGCEDLAHFDFEEEDCRNGGWKLIADEDYIYPKEMGNNGRMEFARIVEDFYVDAQSYAGN